MKRSSKRLWSVLLTLAMLLSIAPVSAYAAGTWPWGWLGGGGTEPYGETSYDAYYYMLLPNFKQGDDSRDPEDFNFVGQGSVADDIGRPNGQYAGSTIRITPSNSGWMDTPEVDKEQNFGNITITTYPDVEYDGKTYVYKGSSNNTGEQHTYEIEWYRYSSSPGYNIGNSSFEPTEYDGLTWHVDGYVKLSDKYTVTYMVKFPGSEEYSNVSAEGEPANNAYVVYVNENSNYTFSQITAPEMEQTLEESGPSGTTVTYRFNGWYYDEGCTSKVDDRAKITDDIVVYGKYVTENVSGSSYLNIKVFLDGKEITLSGDENDQNYWRNYIANVTNVQSTAGFSVDGVDHGLLKCTFDYTNFNSADLAVTPSSSYVLQGVYGTFIYGMYGCSNPVIDSGCWKIDNVQGGSTLTVYLSTPYTVQYHLPGTAGAPTDNDIYVAVKGLDNFTAPDFTGLSSASSVEEKNAGKAGGWVDNSLNYKLKLKPVPTGYTGWYTTDSYTDMHEASYEGEDIATAAKNSGENTPTIIECFGKTAKVNVTYTITGTEKPEDNTVSDMPENTQVYVGSDVTAGRVPTTTSTTNGDKQGSWSFSGWTTKDETENVQEDVEFTGYWTFTANTPALSVKKSVVSINNVAQPATGTLTAIAGDVIEYKIVITNTGNVPLAGVQVSDSLWTAGMTINVGGEVEQLTDTAYTIGELAVGGSVTISYTYTVTTVTDSGTTLTNTATASADGNVTGSDTATVKINGAVTITPADITIYMGGDGGYDAVVGTDGNATSSNSMPRPLFYVSVPEGTDPDNLTLKGNDGREWRFEEAGLDANRVSLFYINSTGYEDQDPVRVQYSRGDEVYVEDEFDPADVHELYTDYVISIYSGGATSVWAEMSGAKYSVASRPGTLRVRAVEDGGEGKNPVVGVETEAPAGPLQPGEAAITAPAGTIYTLNDTTVSVDAEGVGLLFDGIIDDSDANRTGALIAAIESKFNTDSSYWNYQAQYLDLVDAKNGNAWVKASDNVTVYWAYPEGTSMEDDFVLYHFKGLHRDGDNSGFDIGDIAKTEIETVTITKTEQGISFEVTPGGFSPFVLLSHAKTGAELGGITGIEKQLVTARDKYAEFRLSCPDFSGGKVFVERYGKVTLLYSITVSGTPGTAYVVEDAGAVVKEGSLSGVIGADGKAVVYVAKTFDWNDVRTGSLKNTATVEYNDGTSPEDDSDTVETEVVVYDPVTPPVTPSEPDYKPEWLNTEDHYAYIIGYEDGTVRPYGSITRAETATIFFRLLTDEAREEYWTETNSYTDVSRGDWYNTAVSTLSRLGILGGYEDGTFRPNSGITRAEFAKIAVSFFEYEGIEAENVFTDVAHGSWYEDFVAAAAEIGLIEGYEDGSFRPESGITRAEACTIINRTLGRAPDKGHLLPESEMLTWPDNPESAWYYAQMQEATNSHEYKWLGDIEQWLEKLPERDWAA